MKNERQERICPKCGQRYTSPPAVSRADNSLICPDCGTREALETLGVNRTEQDEILGFIHRKEEEIC